MTKAQADIVWNVKEFALLKLLLHKECRDYLGVGASDAVYRAITLIHELGHAASIIYGTDASKVLYDAGNPAQSRANSQLVYENCFR